MSSTLLANLIKKITPSTKRPDIILTYTFAGNAGITTLFETPSDPNSLHELIDMRVTVTTDATVANRNLFVRRCDLINGDLLFFINGITVQTASSTAYYNYKPEIGQHAPSGSITANYLGLILSLGHRFMYYKERLSYELSNGVAGDSVTIMLRIRKLA